MIEKLYNSAWDLAWDATVIALKGAHRALRWLDRVSG